MIKKAVSVSRKSTIHVKTAKKRSVISNAWLKRQLNDEYVIAANRDGYFSRAAYKLIEIDDKEKFLKKGHYICCLWTNYSNSINSFMFK